MAYSPVLEHHAVDGNDKVLVRTPRALPREAGRSGAGDLIASLELGNRGRTNHDSREIVAGYGIFDTEMVMFDVRWIDPAILDRDEGLAFLGA